jgi:hypothetical protein
MLRAGDSTCARAVEQHLYIANSLPRDLNGIQKRRAGDDRGAVLVVMKDGDLQRAPEFFLDEETFRRLDVFEIDAAEGGLE